MDRRRRTLWIMVLCCWLPHVAMAQTLPFGISLPPSLNFATSPAPVGSGARAQGKAVAFIGVADDATAASHNPAGLVQLQEPEASVVGSYFVRLERQDVTQAGIRVENQTFDSVDLNYLSGVYPFRLLARNVVVSLNFQRLFDLKGATDVASPFTTIDGLQRVRSRQEGGLFTISPAVAVQVTPTFSIGAAFNIWPDLFGNGWKQDVTVRGQGFVASGPRVVPFVSNGRISEDFSFRGFNVTMGLLWNITSVFTLGGVVRTPFTARLTRKHASSLTVTLQDGSAPVTTSNAFTERLDLDMPLSYGLGLAARLSDNLTLSLDVSRVHWSDFRLQESRRTDVLLVENGAPSGKGTAVLRGQGNDTTSVRLGAEYLWMQPKLIIPFRAGFFYDPEPGERGTDNFFGFSLGSGITVKKFVFDLAYMFRTGTVQSSATATTVYQHTLLGSVIYHF
jgi:long-subunit fatty acid transport protein